MNVSVHVLAAVFWLGGLFFIAAIASHDFVLGPAASRLDPESPEARRTRRWASWLARLTALAGLAVTLAAVRLGRGG